MIYAINIVKKCDIRSETSRYRHIVICIKLDDERDLGLLLAEMVSEVKDYWVDEYINFAMIELERKELKKYSTRIREKYYEEYYDCYDPVNRMLYDRCAKKVYKRTHSVFDTADEWELIL